MAIVRLDIESDATWQRAWVIDTLAELATFSLLYTTPGGPKRGDIAVCNEGGQTYLFTGNDNYTQITGLVDSPVDLNSDVTGILPVANGGTANSSIAQGSIPYGASTGVFGELNKDTNATRYVSNTGTSNAPAYAQVNLANGVTGDLPYANLAQGSALSVLGVTGNSVADNASIVAATNNQVLVRAGTSVVFGQVNLSSADAITDKLPLANGGTATDISTLALPLGSGQITFPAAQNASSNKNTLDDYEEDVWTPTIGGTGGQSGQVYSAQNGYYVKIGQLVLATFRIVLSTLGTITGNAQIKGFPFTSNSGSNYRAHATMAWANMTTALYYMEGQIVASDTAMTINGTSAAVTSLGALVQGDFANTSVIAGTLIYRADA